MSFKELAINRSSIRKYSDKKVSRDDIISIINTAALSPSACNSQPWRFIVADGDVGAAMHECIIDENYSINRWTVDVSSYIIVCESKVTLMKSLECDSQFYADFDLGGATSAICYAAADLGIGSCIIGLFDEKMIRERFKVPCDVKIRMVIALGYSVSDKPTNKSRKEFSEICSFNEF